MITIFDALSYFPIAIGLGALAIGILAVLRPGPMSKKFGIAASGATLPYVISTGVRDIFIGLTVLILFYLREQRALGWTILSIAIVAVSDFWVVQKYGDKKTSLVHLSGAVIVIAYGAWLLAH